MIKWAPLWAPHATGEFDPNGGQPIKIILACSKCGDTGVTYCSQRMPRTQIARYALLHMHGLEKERWDSK